MSNPPVNDINTWFAEFILHSFGVFYCEKERKLGFWPHGLVPNHIKAVCWNSGVIITKWWDDWLVNLGLSIVVILSLLHMTMSLQIPATKEKNYLNQDLKWIVALWNDKQWKRMKLKPLWLSLSVCSYSIVIFLWMFFFAIFRNYSSSLWSYNWKWQVPCWWVLF